MKQYMEMAKRYFLELEGLHLYPSKRDPLSWAWIIASVLWLAAIGYGLSSIHGEIGHLAAILVFEIIWLAVTFKITNRKGQLLIEETNRRYNTSFQSTAECRRYILGTVTNSEPPQFLRLAKEIDELLSLRKKFQKRTELVVADLPKIFYDRDSKARLLTLTVALFSILVVFSAHSNATLDTLFDAFSDAGYKHLVFLFLIISIGLFITLFLLRILLSTIVDAYASWYLKFCEETAFIEWLLSYLVRDLVGSYEKGLDNVLIESVSSSKTDA